MNLEVIVATIEQTDYSLHERMNISSDALICNQHNTESFHSIDWKGKCVRYLSTKESGAGINRNQGLLRAKGDILLFADDDMVYHDSYEKLVLEAFHQLPNADMIFFNVDSSGDPIKRESIERITRVRKHNAFRYGTVRLAIRRRSQVRHGVWFPMDFGPGSKYPSGEDSLFISTCIKHGLVIYAVPIEIGVIQTRASTWFDGFTKGYFISKGALFAALFKRCYLLYAIYYVVRHPAHRGERSVFEVLNFIRTGAKEYLKGEAHENESDLFLLR